MFQVDGVKKLTQLGSGLVLLRLITISLFLVLGDEVPIYLNFDALGISMYPT